MAVPVFCNTPTTPFLSELHGKSFTTYYSFDFSDPKAFFKALGSGVLSHAGMTYSKVQTFLNTTWNPKVRPLLAVSEKYAHLKNGCFSSPDYWRDVGLACSELCISHFKNVEKTEQAEIVRKGGCPSKENAVAYKAMATYFNLCMVYYEQTEQGIFTHVFYNNEAKNEVSLFVHLAQDGQRLYLLFHSEFTYNTTVDVPRFPYFMLTGSSSGPVIVGTLKGSYGQSASASSEGTEALIKALLAVVEEQAKLIVGECKFLKVESMPTHNELKRKVTLTKTLLGLNKVQGSLDTESMKAVLNLQASKQAAAVQRPPHTIETCFQYPEVGRLISFHFHNFHEECLRNYIDSLGLQYPNLPKCPVSDCSELLPEAALDASPTVKAVYNQWKAEITGKQRAYTVDPQGGSSTYVQANRTLPADLQCLYQCMCCSRNCAPAEFLSHGCYVCVSCGHQACFQNRYCCPACNMQFPQNDLESIQYYAMQLTMYYGQNYQPS